MKRRSFVLGSAGAFCGEAVLAQVLKKDEFKPYFEVKPIVGEEDMVRVYYSPSCVFSKQYFSFFKNLQMTLPENKRFAFTPLINRSDGTAYALAYSALTLTYPKYVNNFVQASLEGVQERGQTVRNWPGIDRIARAAQIPVSLPELTNANLQAALAEANRLIQIQSRFGVKNTPAVAVAGTYWVTPEITSGDSAQFSQLVNAIISMTQ